jgi:hypothetical protein
MKLNPLKLQIPYRLSDPIISKLVRNLALSLKSRLYWEIWEPEDKLIDQQISSISKQNSLMHSRSK